MLYCISENYTNFDHHTSCALSILAVSEPHTEKNMRPELGSSAMPRGLLTCTETTVLQRNLTFLTSLVLVLFLREQRRIISLESSKKYQLPEAQSNAIWFTESSENMSNSGRVQVEEGLSTDVQSITDEDLGRIVD